MRAMSEVSGSLSTELKEARSANNERLFGIGIDVVRNRIKGFAQKKVTLPAGRHKIVILDEADRSVSVNVEGERTRRR